MQNKIKIENPKTHNKYVKRTRKQLLLVWEQRSPSSKPKDNTVETSMKQISGSLKGCESYKRRNPRVDRKYVNLI